MKVTLLLIVLFFAGLAHAWGQIDTSQYELPPENSLKAWWSHHPERFSPRRAGLLSAALPGLGQAYNGQYWKIPIVYAGIAGLGYFIFQNEQMLNYYTKAFNETGGQANQSLEGVEIEAPEFPGFAETLNIPPTVFDVNGMTTDQIRTLRDFYRRNRDFTIILSAVWYTLNVADAIVSAHLLHFNVNEDLALDLQPEYGPSLGKNHYAGLSLTLSMN